MTSDLVSSCSRGRQWICDNFAYW